MEELIEKILELEKQLEDCEFGTYEYDQLMEELQLLRLMVDFDDDWT